jgi:homoaconitase/3-isopropylmalate dehydratase large subunit
MPAGAASAPFAKEYSVRVLLAAAADATSDQVIGVVSAAGAIVSATYTPDTVLTGADTNSATLEILNAGAAGSGTTQAAAKAFTNGVNAAAKDETTLTLNATAANQEVVAGDVLVFRRTKVGTGLATPAGFVRVMVGTT